MNLYYFSQDLEVQQVGEQVGHQVHEQAGKNIDPDAMTELPPSTPTSQSRRLSIKESTTEAKATGNFLLFICPHKNVLSELKVNTVVIVNSMSFPSRFRQLLIPCLFLPDSDKGSSSTQLPSVDERWISSPSVSPLPPPPPPPQKFPKTCFICQKGFLNEKLLLIHKQVIHPNL